MEKESIARAAVDYFENINSTAFPTRVEEVVDTIPSKVTEEMIESFSLSGTVNLQYIS